MIITVELGDLDLSLVYFRISGLTATTLLFDTCNLTLLIRKTWFLMLSPSLWNFFHKYLQFSFIILIIVVTVLIIWPFSVFNILI